MGAYDRIKDSFIEGYKGRSEQYQGRLLEWRSGQPIVRVGKPTNIARARELGYKAKQGIIIARAKVRGGKKKRRHFDGGRKPSKTGRFYSRAKSLQAIAEERAARRFSNYEVLSSYFVGRSGSDAFFEVIMADPRNPSIKNDRAYRGAARRGRAFRGLTKQGRKYRGRA